MNKTLSILTLSTVLLLALHVLIFVLPVYALPTPPPTFSKSFAPNPIAPGNDSTLSFTIDNTASVVDATSLDFTDNLPAGITIASPANAAVTCTGGTLTATVSSNTIAYTGGTATAGAICDVSVDVTGNAVGAYVNTTGDLTSSSGISGSASDTLTIPVPFTDCASQGSIPQSECQALVDLYDNTNGAGWTGTTGWKSAPDLCNWTGVTCSGSNVTELILSSKNLTGTIPSTISNLTQLTALILGNNFLAGSIPATIVNLTQLEGLWLSQNSLTGFIPSDIDNLSLLRYLDLKLNKLSGAIPPSLTNLNLWPTNGLDLNNNCLNTNVTKAISDYIFEKSNGYEDWKTTQGKSCFSWPMFIPATTNAQP